MVNTTTADHSQLLKLFSERYSRLNGIPVLADNADQAAQKAVEIIVEGGGKTLYIASAFNEVLPAIEKAAKEAGIQVWKGFRGREAVEKLKTADAAMTAAACAVAESGAVVEVAYDDDVRLASSLPKTHIMLVKASTIYRSVTELAELLRKTLLTERAAITFISGPSRSGDIEQRLVVGIHGPHRVAALVMKWL